MNDNSCKSTYVTLSVYHGEMTPAELTKSLGMNPTRTCVKNSKRIKKNGWFLTTKDLVVSTKLEDHLISLLNNIIDSRRNLSETLTLGAEARIYCFWVSANGNGGPVLSANTLKQLSELGIDLHFDIWFDEARVGQISVA